MIVGDLLLENELFIAREDAHKLSIEDMDPKMEYYPCDDNKGNCIVMNGYKYCIVKKRDKIEICVNEDVPVKYWDHKYISADLWFNSYVKAVEKHKKCVKVYRDVDPHQLMSLLYYFDLEAEDYKNLKEVIDDADKILKDIEEETINIAKRTMIKFFNE